MRSIKLLTVIFMISNLTGADYCQSPHYLEISTTGTIQCSFSSDFISVHWYDTTENLQVIDPILSYEGSSKRGDGFVSGEFDIHPNGSLIINDVNIKHETKFTVTVVVSTTKIPESFIIVVKVTVSPAHPFPLVNATLLTDEIVQFVEIGRESSLLCNVEGSRPLMPLSWSIRTNDGDMDIPFNNYSINNSGRFSSFSTLRYRFSTDVYIALLVCKADDSLMLLDRYETFILAQNKDIDLERFTATSAVYLINTKVQLQCSENQHDVVVWKKITQRKIMETVAFAVSPRPNYTKLLSDDVILSSDGTLIIPDVSIQHEGQYVCIHQDQNTNGIEVHNLTVIVNPSPSYPVFDGCNHDQYCVLEVEREGTLLCSLSGIRPSVTLTMRSYHEDEMISFSRQNMETVGHDNVFDVHLQVWFTMHPTAKSGRITVECTATGDNSGYFTSLSTQIDLQFFAGDVTDAILDEHKTRLNLWYIIGTASGIITVCLVSIIIIFTVLKCRPRARRKSERDKKFVDEEVVLLMTETIHEKLDEFVQQLSTTYKEICSSIQPIPYEMDKRYSVKDIFVDGGLKIIHSNSLERKGSATDLLKYKGFIDVLQEKGSHIIIEGEPGYGKTMYTLRIIYDWLKKKQTSPVEKFQLLLYIPLREVPFKMSLSEIIKQLLLPKDSLITVSDIADIISKSTSTLIILDGYDELIGRDKESNINDIIARKLVQNSNVILTTRSSILPRQYSANAKRFRLIGFDHVTQKEYLRNFLKSKALASQNNTDSFMNNPIMDDICKVPLVFAVFAKFSQEVETSQKFGAVRFFQLAVSSYHYHLQNKEKVDKKAMTDNLHLEWNNEEINKLAFDSLRKDEEDSYWSREHLNNTLGRECVNYLIAVGIFAVEEKASSHVDISGCASIKKEQNVRFSLRVFAEWHAAHYVKEVISSTYAKQRNSRDFDILYDLDPFNQEYLFRFVCGLSAVAADVITEYLKNIGNGEKLAILCSLEKLENITNDLKKVQDLCREVVQFDPGDTKLAQRASLQLLSVASNNKIPIAAVSIDGCLGSLDCANGDIYLKYNLRLPVLSTLKKLTICDKKKQFSDDEMKGILKFCLKCRKLKFLSFENCLLPNEIICWKEIAGGSNTLQVLWCPTGTWYRLDDKYDTWQTCDLGQPMTEAGYQNEENFCRMFLD